MARMKLRIRGRWQWVEIGPDLNDMMERQLQAFRKKFGRDPGPTDPIFFDPDKDQPEPYDQAKFHRQVLDVMKAADLPGHLVYAWEKTGLMVTEDNRVLLSKKDLREWDEAIEEYWRLHPEERPTTEPPTNAPRRSGRPPRSRRRRGRS